MDISVKHAYKKRLGAWGLLAFLLVLGPLVQGETALTLDEAFEALFQYDYGESRIPLRRIEAEIATASDEHHDALLARFTAALEDDLSVAAIEFVCKQLALIADGKAVPSLEPVLHNPETSHLARYALDAIPDKSAETALIESMDHLTGAPLIGAIHSLGTRQSLAAVGPLTGLLEHQDTAIVTAAASALGLIGSEAALSTLEETLDEFPSDSMPVVADSLMANAEEHRKAGRKEAARDLYQRVQKRKVPAHIQAAAYGGQVALVEPEEAAAMIGETYHEKDDAHAKTVTQYIRHWPDDTAMSFALAEHLEGLSPQRTVWFLWALRDRGDGLIRDYVGPLMKHEALDVRMAAYEALAVLGDRHNSMDLLAAAVAADSALERESARKALHRLPDTGVPEVLKPVLDDWLSNTGDPALVAEALHALTAHHAVDAVPRLMELADDTNKAGALAAFDALSELGNETHIAPMLQKAIDTKSTTPRDRAIAAATAMGRHVESPSTRLEPYRAVLAEVETVQAAETMLIALAQIPTPATLDLIEATAQAHPETLTTAIQLLSDWPTLDAVDPLLALGAMSEDDTLKMDAVSGALRLLALPTELPSETLLTYYEKVLDLAPNTDSITRVFDALPLLEDPAAVALVEPYVDDPDLQNAAQSAIARIRRAAYQPSASHRPETARNAIDGSSATRWATGEPQSGGEWFMLDLGSMETISSITVDSGASPENRFRGYAVYLAEMGSAFADVPITESDTPEAVETIEFPPTPCQYIRIEQTGSDTDHEWAIYEIRIHRTDNN